MKVTFYNDKVELNGEFQIQLPKDKTVKDLLGELRNKLGEEYEGKKIVLMQTLPSKILKICDPLATLATLRECYWGYRAEVVPPPDEDGNVFIQVCHFRSGGGDVSNIITFGVPFWLKIQASDTVADIKPRMKANNNNKIFYMLRSRPASFATINNIVYQQRMKAKVGMPDDEFAKCKFAYHSHHSQPIEYLMEEDLVLGRYAGGPCYLDSDGTKYYGNHAAFWGLMHEDT